MSQARFFWSITLLVLVGGCASAPPQAPANQAANGGASDSWYTGFPRALDRVSTRTLQVDQFAEVPVSHFESAQALLESVSFTPLTNGYFGHFPQCPAGTRPYLVRAIFERTNGTFLVRVAGTELLVLNLAPGPSEPQKRSALAVCLDFQPTAVHTATGGPM
jgi:hypothetical protein